MSNRLPYAVPTSNGKTDRLEDQLRLWDHVGNMAEKRDVDGIYILGDLLDKALVDPVTLTETVRAMMGLPRPVYFLPGNHDAASLRGERFTVEAFGEMGRSDFHVIGMPQGGEHPKPLKVRKWLFFWPVAFMPASETMGTLAKVGSALNPKITNVLLFHNSIEGAKHLGWVCDDGMDASKVVEHFDWVLSGHFHDCQEFGDGRGMYLGAPMHHHYGDVGRDAGYWIITLNDQGDREDEFIDPGLPHFHIFTDLKTKAKNVLKGDYVRFEVHATYADWVNLVPEAEAAVGRLRDQGVHADYKHKPIYHHKTRLKTTKSKGGEAKISWDDAISEYVDAVDVVTGGLDSKVLKQVGRDILTAVRSTDGPV